MASSDSESFTLITTQSSHSISPDYTDFLSAKVADVDIQMTKSLREHYPELCITVVQASNAPLIEFAAAGFATAELDTKTESIFRWRGFVPSEHRGGTGQLGEARFFAKYHYSWSDKDFILYTVTNGPSVIQYILKEPDSKIGEHTLSNCAATDALISACAKANLGVETDFVYVYDDYWTRSRTLWEEVQRASWSDVILDPKMKRALQNVTKNFFDSKELYERYGVPWKRGLIFYGPPGNGKTISIKALMKELSLREKGPIPTLYVKFAPYTYDIGEVFSFARTMSPCLLVLEDVETIVTQDTRSYFFNEVDGLGNNDGIMMVASTNYLNRLDPGLSRRPSRFDRKYNFPLPNCSERTEYAQYWRQKLAKSNPSIDFPKSMCLAIANITKQFSFAYMQEAFIASLLMLAREDQDEGGEEINADDTFGEQEYKYSAEIKFHSFAERRDDEDDPLAKNKLWHAMKVNVKLLRKDLEDHQHDDDDDNIETNHVDRYAREPSQKSKQVSSHSPSPKAGVPTHQFAASQNRRAMPNLPLRPVSVAKIEPPSNWLPGRLPQAFPRTDGVSRARNTSNRDANVAGWQVNPRSTSNIPFNPRVVTPLPRDNMAPAMQRGRREEPSQEEMTRAGVVKRKSLTETAFETNSGW